MHIFIKKNKGMEEKNNEIDLLEVFSALSNRISRFFKWIINLVLFAISFLIKNLFLYLAILAVTIGLSFLKSKYAKDVYRSTLTAQSNVISTPEIVNIINNIQKAIKEDSKEYVAGALGCSLNDVKKIKDIEALYIIDNNRDGIADFIDFDHKLLKKSATDTNFIVLPNEFALKLDYNDTSVIRIVKKGIFNYLRQNPYIKERDTLNRRQLWELIAKVDKELNDFDTLQTNYNKFIVNNQRGQDLKSQLLMVNEKEVKLMYKDILSLYAEKQQLEQRYALSTREVITIKSDFIPSSSPLSGTFKFSLNLFIHLSLILTMLIGFIKNRKNIYTKLNSYYRDGVKY